MPSVSLRNSLSAFGSLKSNMFSRLPARLSKVFSPSRPRSQLSWMNRGTDACSVYVWSTLLTLAYAEIASSGWRVPGPH